MINPENKNDINKLIFKQLKNQNLIILKHLVIIILVVLMLVLIHAKIANPNVTVPLKTNMKTFENQITLGDDWWLPKWVEPLPDVIGFYGENPEDVPNQTLKLVALKWRDINPQEGVYDWSILENALKQSNNIYIRLENSDVIHCPKWLKQKYPDLEPFKLNAYKDIFSVNSPGLFYPMWHRGFQTEFIKLLQSFKEHNFGSHPHLKFAYIPGAWEWGEFDVLSIEQMLEQGMTPNDFLDWFKGIIDAYVDAFGEDNAHKLMYTGLDVIPLCDGNIEWKKIIDRNLFKYVINRGGSNRFGLPEKYNFVATDMPNYGISVLDIGDGKYMVTDDEAPLIAEAQRFIGSESEELGNENIPVSNYQQLKRTALKNLQLRANVVFLGREVWSKAPELHHYMLKSLGRHYYDSPDAWVALREGKDVYQLWSRWHFGERKDWWIRNWERWLFQREIEPDGKTVRTFYQKIPVKYNEESYEARRTDHKNGSNYIYFGVDDRFIRGGSNKIKIKVTYLDNNNSKWWIEYDSSSHNFYQKTAAVININDSQWKTVSFDIQDAAFLNRQIGAMDFRIFNGGDKDLTVGFVRVIKLEKPNR